MGFVVMFCLSWVTVSVLLILKPTITRTKLASLYFIVLIVNINVNWIVIEELKWIEVTENGLLYTGYLISRSILTPTLILLFVHLVSRNPRIGNTLVLLLLFAGILSLIASLASLLDITTFIKWNVVYHFVFILLLEGIALFFLRFLPESDDREGQNL
ncbi:hypothetical protein Q75_16965 [Bacillus coahuilensis p1.1.43]|uniref:Uncharacterized protein n=1 Tax=Bacillus coahuilensis p1.1.43 TaxID=1150625 RepID=A0A147K3Y0_9BACI|nr:hypothetical protein [Bacillus coahuilensis]KUP04006.1 hypothetical protein Q75_16965 [Bacillus coahuilensis p1.1.43]